MSNTYSLWKHIKNNYTNNYFYKLIESALILIK